MKFAGQGAKTRKIFALMTMPVVFALLSACGGAPSSPTHFVADISNGKMIGKYNPAGFDAAEVKSLLSDNCASRRLAAYGEQAAGELVAFTATCEGGMSAAGGNIEFEKLGSEVLTESTTYDDNGDLSMTRTKM